MKYEIELIKIAAQENEIKKIFQILWSFNLDKVFLCAGSLRNMVWDHLANRQPNFLRNNLDLIYLDQNQSYEEFLTLQELIKLHHANYLWNLENVCLNNSSSHQPYGKTITAALKTIPETCNAVGLNLTRQDHFQVIAPFGLTDLFNFEIHPTPTFAQDPHKLTFYQQRIAWKEWAQAWKNLKVFNN
ncbi:nucleotidyltransferase family protein [Liquorilactobacillus sicerae]|uniref:nucleotidyltransferase family protein n=1 Tax=Liquorilactobacillus sicerae TaxID=1416943 RepID=UPI00248129D2|nr:nucleotidyltransferase family protein [Liquorilactobacillus sicerae]